ncbi:MAG: phosphatase PAP2 family protein [Sulfuriferula multivorans]|uniref:Phosphatase PAP2 family protein n=1 Tax=Sulfuriferula multivorans TaxID=1559896 RepID=A0A7C9NT08_9PROT|nr:phosphatase PAP2 family protein [Sulfuriferula multivorans]
MIFELVEDIVKMVLIVASLYFILGETVRRMQPTWSEPLGKRRLITLSVLILAVSAIKLIEDVVGGESGPIDRTILLFIHGHVPRTLSGFFEAVTLTGSSWFLFPLATVATIALLWAKRRFEALLVAASVISAAMLIYLIKMVVGRARPILWDTEWYWGSSFPSGHTLAVAAFATAAALCISRIRPASRNLALSLAILWITLVAMSRLVLGVHWPTDVLVAACIGAFLPLAMSVVLELRHVK